MSEFDRLTVASSHGSPWRYDTFVPLIFAGSFSVTAASIMETRSVPGMSAAMIGGLSAASRTGPVSATG